MKRLSLFILLFLLFFPPCQLLSQNLAPTVFAFAGFRIASDHELENALDSGFGVSVALANKTRIGFSLSFSRHAVGGPDDDSPLLSRDMTAAPFMIYLEQELIGGEHFSTYASFGAGIQFSGLQGFDRVTVPENTITQSIEAGFIIRAAGGMTLAVLSHVRLFAEGAYLAGRQAEKRKRSS